MTACHLCGKTLDIPEPVGRKETCPFCRSDLRCCLNCGLYNTAAPNACREPHAEHIAVKERGNFCDFFRLRRISPPSAGNAKTGNARERLDSLFRPSRPEG